jgi:gliding motility-associated-like protein
MVTVAEAKVHPATAFTPNDDGVNDAWVLEDMIYYPDAEVTIFNRWGEQLFNANGMEYAENPWDGTYKGRKLPFGAYFYIINLKNGDKPMTGSVTILK